MKKNMMLQKISDMSQKVAKPLTRLARIPEINAIQNGLVAITPVIILGSIFITLYTFGSPSIGDSGKAILPFLEPYVGFFSTFNGLTMGILSFYAAISISYSYAKNLKLDLLSTTLLGVGAFLLINVNEQNGSISTASFGAAGLFITIIVVLVSIRIYKFLVDHKITIRLPESVPENVLNAFSSLIPYLATFGICWMIRSIFNINLFELFNVLITPILRVGDNILFFGFASMMHGLFWSVGLHWDNMTSSVIDSLVTVFSTSNVTSFVSNESMPYIYTNGLYRITIVNAIFYPILILMIFSKLKQNRTLGLACLPSSLFCITEPITFGILAFNPFFVIPMILSGLLGGLITYGATLIGFVAPFHAILPWATPTLLYGFLGSGIGAVVIQFVLIAVGLCIYYPFFKAYEKNQLAEIENLS